jgi:tRNA (guanine6-N2)-methyltransferase
MHRVMVRTLRGLEAVARTEVHQLLGPVPVAVEHRALRFAVARLDARLLSLGTVDDAFLVLAETGGIDHRRSSLKQLAAVGRIDGPGAVAALDALRPRTRTGETTRAALPIGARRSLPGPIAFDVTASFIGRRNFSRFDVEDAVGAAIAAETGWTHLRRGPRAPTGAASLSFRVHVLHEDATLAVRLGERPLHRGGYRVWSRPGALHPPLGRALCLVAEPTAGCLLVDPACGVGNIPIEAALLEPRADVAGFDLAPDAISAARCNVHRAGAAVRLAVADATRLPLDDGTIDRLVVNPPWGAAVIAAGGLRRRRAALWTEAARVLAPGGRLVALLPAGSGSVGAGLDVEVAANVRVHGAEAIVVRARR